MPEETKKIDADYILEQLKKGVEDKAFNDKHAYDAEFWLDTATKLNLCLYEEQNKLFLAQQKLAEKENEIYKTMEKPVMSRVKSLVETTPEWLKFKEQFVKIKNIEEFIKISKKRVDVASGF